MLAQNFLTAEQLCIHQNEHDALVMVLGMLERGELVHFNYSKQANYPPTTKLFNMNDWTSICGTVHCIGGWAEVVGDGVDFWRRFMMLDENALWELFYPWRMTTSRISYESITVEQAACALRNYLTTGAAMWDDVIAAV